MRDNNRGGCIAMKLQEFLKQKGVKPETHVIISPSDNAGENKTRLHSLRMEIIKIKQEDIYSPSNARGKFALHSTALNRIALAAGLQWDSQTGIQLDEKYKSRAKAVGTMANGKGVMVKFVAECTYEIFPEEEQFTVEEQAEYGDQRKRWTMENGNKTWPAWPTEEEKATWIRLQVGKIIINKRRHKNEKAETGARARVIREALNIKLSWDEQELFMRDTSNQKVLKPWAIITVDVDPEKVMRDSAFSGYAAQLFLKGNIIFDDERERMVAGPKETDIIQDFEPVEDEPEEVDVSGKSIAWYRKEFLDACERGASPAFCKRVEQMQGEICWNVIDLLKGKYETARAAAPGLFEKINDEEIPF
jgi:hypothetical protein